MIKSIKANKGSIVVGLSILIFGWIGNMLLVSANVKVELENIHNNLSVLEMRIESLSSRIDRLYNQGRK